MTLADKRDDLGETKRLMGALVRMKPKPHDEMKVGKKPKQGIGRPTPRPRACRHLSQARAQTK